MKSNLVNRIIGLNIALLFAGIVFSHCSNQTTNKKEDGNKDTAIVSADSTGMYSSVDTSLAGIVSSEVTRSPASNDTVALKDLIKTLYKWYWTTKRKYDGFNPLKNKATDTAYSRIDLVENQKSIEELKQTGLFAGSFLNDYRKVAVRMDKELQDGSSFWREGEIPTFSRDADEWCDCQDSPVDDFWNIIELKGMKISGNKATFKWTWGDDHYYNIGAVKQGGIWKISYMQGFDMKAYNWGRGRWSGK